MTVASSRTSRSISATLQHDGWIAGTVSGPKLAGQGLTGICVQAVPVSGDAAPFLTSSAEAGGSYELGPLRPGRYLVKFFAGCGATGYNAQWWENARSARTATPVRVSANRTRPGVDATMTSAG